jgi:hypothetical protein
MLVAGDGIDEIGMITMTTSTTTIVTAGAGAGQTAVNGMMTTTELAWRPRQSMPLSQRNYRVDRITPKQS